jgi:hypothetical protein
VGDAHWPRGIRGRTVSATIADILDREPEWTRCLRISPSTFSGCCDAASKEIRGADPAMSAMRRSSPATSFPVRYAGELAARNNCMPAADGKRFLINTSSTGLGTRVAVVLDWAAAVRGR